MQEDLTFTEWLATRPEKIQALVRQYPPADYRIKPGAPYSISCPGTLVSLVSYRENGTVSVAIEYANLQEAALNHMAERLAKTGRTLADFGTPTQRVVIDPVYLEPIVNP